MSRADISVRPLEAQEQFREAVRLQQEIWEFEDVELLPVRLFVVASKVGGQAFGAYDGERMVGFALAIPGIKPGAIPYLHSQMVGVRSDYRNCGVGRLLKLRQRADALGRDIHLMEWTFDPLEIRNAYFNIERLGAIVRRYVRNQYGETTSVLHGGMPTDRCTCEWWMPTTRVEHAIAGQPFARPAPQARIEVPGDFAAIRDRDKARAKDILAAVSARFEAEIARGLAVVGFERTANGGSYLLGQWNENR